MSTDTNKGLMLIVGGEVGLAASCALSTSTLVSMWMQVIARVVGRAASLTLSLSSDFVQGQAQAGSWVGGSVLLCMCGVFVLGVASTAYGRSCVPGLPRRSRLDQLQPVSSCIRLHSSLAQSCTMYGVLGKQSQAVGTRCMVRLCACVVEDNTCLFC